MKLWPCSSLIYTLSELITDLFEAVLTIGLAALAITITVSAIRAVRWFYLRHPVAG